MKKNIAIFGLLFILASTWVALDSSSQAQAVSGCCKTRISQDDPWIKFGTDLESCKVKNELEEDNVFQKNGMVWWDTAC